MGEEPRFYRKQLAINSDCSSASEGLRLVCMDGSVNTTYPMGVWVLTFPKSPKKEKTLRILYSSPQPFGN